MRTFDWQCSGLWDRSNGSQDDSECKGEVTEEGAVDEVAIGDFAARAGGGGDDGGFGVYGPFFIHGCRQLFILGYGLLFVHGCGVNDFWQRRRRNTSMVSCGWTGFHSARELGWNTLSRYIVNTAVSNLRKVAVA